MLNVRGPAIPALCRKSGHLYFGGTGHLHFGPTGQGLIAWVASTLAPNEGYAPGAIARGIETEGRRDDEAEVEIAEAEAAGGGDRRGAGRDRDRDVEGEPGLPDLGAPPITPTPSALQRLAPP